MEYTKKIHVTKHEHSFYCDKCGTLVLSSIEYDDGYYEEPHRAVCGFYLEKDYMEKDFGCLCNECLANEVSKYKDQLCRLGFTITRNID